MKTANVDPATGQKQECFARFSPFEIEEQLQKATDLEPQKRHVDYLDRGQKFARIERWLRSRALLECN